MFEIPARLEWLKELPEGRRRIAQIPEYVEACAKRWPLALQPPFEDSYVTLVFPAITSDGLPVVLKLQFPHDESKDEAKALRCWNGDAAVLLLDSDEAYHALLLERCEPGTHLANINADAALEILAEMLPRLWISSDSAFPSLEEVSAVWMRSMPMAWQRSGQPFKLELLSSALEAIDALRSSMRPKILANQDLHGDNVLKARRQPWLMIDPKPLLAEKEFTLAPIIRS